MTLLLLTVASASAQVDPYVGVHVGPAFSTNAFAPAIAPRLELGLELPLPKRILRVFVAGHWLRPVASGTGREDRLAGGGSYEWTLKQHELAVALGPTLRLPFLGGPLVPELSAGPELYMYESRVDGSAGGAAFGETRERYTRLGVYGAVGAALKVAIVELVLNVAATSSALGGVVAGDANHLAIVPMLGVRLVP